MSAPDPVAVGAVLTGLAALVGAVYAGHVQLRKLRYEHQLAMKKYETENYLVDHEEIEDLRWWRRLGIKVVNAFLDDYATREIEPPVDALKVLQYPPRDRPRDKSKGRLE